jgi:dipeptidyl aminopeptidase/acylaminoacyl peptidase
VDGSERQQLTSAPMKVEWPRWSPDGRRIVFDGKMPGDVWKAYLTAAAGGAPKEIAPGRIAKHASWSSDGMRLVAMISNQPRSSISVLDLQTGELSPVPGSDDLEDPNWSPDGRYICASRHIDDACMLFDYAKQAWSEISSSSCWWANWTSDSKSFFYLEGKGESIRRFDVSTGKFQAVASLKDYRITGNYLTWLGISPDNSPIILRDAGSQEVYALEWQTR